MSELYSLEHSQYSEECGTFPFHITTLGSAANDGMEDLLYNTRGPNKWQVIFTGTWDECYQTMRRVIEFYKERFEKFLPIPMKAPTERLELQSERRR